MVKVWKVFFTNVSIKALCILYSVYGWLQANKSIFPISNIWKPNFGLDVWTMAERQTYPSKTWNTFLTQPCNFLKIASGPSNHLVQSSTFCRLKNPVSFAQFSLPSPEFLFILWAIGFLYKNLKYVAKREAFKSVLRIRIGIYLFNFHVKFVYKKTRLQGSFGSRSGFFPSDPKRPDLTGSATLDLQRWTGVSVLRSSRYLIKLVTRNCITRGTKGSRPVQVLSRIALVYISKYLSLNLLDNLSQPFVS